MKEVFVPDGLPAEAAMKRITHLGIGAHADDLEFMAFHGIIAGYEKHRFGGVVCTDGAGSPGAGQEIVAVRRREQNQAASIGRYGVMIQLGYKSRELTGLSDALKQILAATRPQVVYTHNPFDKHPTHIAVLRAALEAMREHPPAKIIGCEVWRDLDWVPDADKVVMDVSGHDELVMQLNACFESQIAGGKRYDLAIQGRRRAHATFSQSHASDKATALIYGIDLTPALHDVAGYVAALIEKFKADVLTNYR